MTHVMCHTDHVKSPKNNIRRHTQEIFLHILKMSMTKYQLRKYRSVFKMYSKSSINHYVMREVIEQGSQFSDFINHYFCKEIIDFKHRRTLL